MPEVAKSIDEYISKSISQTPFELSLYTFLFLQLQ
jgi:hypothetical protein